MKKLTVNLQSGEQRLADLSPAEIAARPTISRNPGQGRQRDPIAALYAKLVAKGVLTKDDVPTDLGN
jgi:hypothetical protein